MQKQLLQIADRIPDDILLTLLKCFAQLLTHEAEQATKPSGPFIRAFAKIRDDGERQFSAILEEDEDQNRDEKIIEPAIEAEENSNEGDNECTFNYKITNVVTQEVLYSVGNNEEDNVENEIDEQQKQQQQQQAHDDDNDQEIIESLQNAEEENKENIATTSDDDNCEDFEIVNNNNDENQVEVVEDEQAEIDEEISNNDDDDQIADNIEKEIDDESAESDEKPQIDERENIQPLEKVSLDDIQREIQEMQMFLFNKGVTQENKSQSNINHELITTEKSQAKVEDAYKVDVCINLKKKGSERKHTKSKAILSNYINKSSHTKNDNHNHIFDPSVPNTPEDFLKEKSVTEKINKKKQKIKHLDMSWQKLCDDQKKVYKHSNFKIPKSERSIVDEQKNI